jgi:DNA-directed RNA polymerase subunit alpha
MFLPMRLISKVLINTVILVQITFGLGTQFLSVPSNAIDLAFGSSPLLGKLALNNPALLTAAPQGINMHMSYGSWLSNVSASSFALASKLNRGNIGLQLRHMGLNDLELRTTTPTDLPLATLNEDAELNFSLLIHQGIGYVPSEDLRDELPEGYIALDAFFTPVRAANYTIENMLVEDNPNYEKIVFDIETDGQIDPVTAFKHTIEVMYRQMSVFNNILDINIAEETTTSTVESSLLKTLMQGIDTLGLSARSFNSLERAGLKYLGELVLMSESELKEIKNLGKKSLEEIKAKLEEIGFPVGSELDDETAKQLKKKIEATKK